MAGRAADFGATEGLTMRVSRIAVVNTLCCGIGAAGAWDAWWLWRYWGVVTRLAGEGMRWLGG